VKVNDDDPGGITIPTWYGDDTISETDNGSNTPSKFLGEFSSYIDDVVMVSNTRTSLPTPPPPYIDTNARGTLYLLYTIYHIYAYVPQKVDYIPS
jgi:hypothetical protein